MPLLFFDMEPQTVAPATVGVVFAAPIPAIIPIQPQTITATFAAPIPNIVLLADFATGAFAVQAATGAPGVVTRTTVNVNATFTVQTPAGESIGEVASIDALFAIGAPTLNFAKIVNASTLDALFALQSFTVQNVFHAAQAAPVNALWTANDAITSGQFATGPSADGVFVVQAPALLVVFNTPATITGGTFVVGAATPLLGPAVRVPLAVDSVFNVLSPATIQASVLNPAPVDFIVNFDPATIVSGPTTRAALPVSAAFTIPAAFSGGAVPVFPDEVIATFAFPAPIVIGSNKHRGSFARLRRVKGRSTGSSERTHADLTGTI